MMKFWWNFLFFSFLFLCSCQEEKTEDVLISEQNYVEIATLVDKEKPLFLLDNGTFIKVQSDFISQSLVITKRMLLRYNYTDQKGIDTLPVYVSASRPVETSFAIEGDYFTNFIIGKERTPAVLHRFWLGGNYLNCELGYDLFLAPHYVRLFVVKKETNTIPPKLYLNLFHSKLADPLGTYYHNYYSFDLSKFLDPKEKELMLSISFLTKDSITTYERLLQR